MPEFHAPDGDRPSTGTARKARALLSMIEGRGDVPADVPPERLRDWARDLVETIERGRADASPQARPAKPAPRLFTHGAPTLTMPETGSSGAEVRVPDKPAAASQAPTSGAGRTDVAKFVLPRVEVGEIIETRLDRDHLRGEHPAIIARTLIGRRSLDQAALLRTLPGPQMRAVHRALRQLEGQAA
ncbi:hypothetical protein MWU52_11820 [Jannaschia sp. S6380]|uniref:hypothetical protein n=1 Tax=Jannaschia sp. S6380 TaxID=2926408 RepID=UPI001FF24CD3|nr:hypothetical protein [Jannaschia sp. S6380]MCK0168243.1 hypothetical protein [Jannaschia sp. S6380]